MMPKVKPPIRNAAATFPPALRIAVIMWRNSSLRIVSITGDTGLHIKVPAAAVILLALKARARATATRAWKGIIGNIPANIPRAIPSASSWGSPLSLVSLR